MATPKSIAFHTLGCKLNYSETSSIRQQFDRAGYSVVKFDQPADFYVLNTCSVTDFADRKCRYEVRKARRQNPDARVIIIGCYAQLKPDEIAEIEGVDMVLGAGEKFNILKHVESMDHSGSETIVHKSELQAVNSFVDAFSFGDRTRSFLKVQDGCEYKCSFCTIPQARGKSRSDTIENVVANARKIGDKGVKEIVLTGVNIGDFGLQMDGIAPGDMATRDKERPYDFLDLIKALDKVENVERFRISSIEPNLCHNEIIDFVTESHRFMPHFHMPLQSGSNDILKKMRRRYRRELYADRVEYIKTRMPHCCIGVDVIVGFPGETEAHFAKTYDFIKDLDISYLHVFTYSERANTPAAGMNGMVPMGKRKERNRRLRILSERKRSLFYESQIGSERLVLLESRNKDGVWEGFTDNYVKVGVSRGELEGGMIVGVGLEELKDHKVKGSVQGTVDRVQ